MRTHGTRSLLGPKYLAEHALGVVDVATHGKLHLDGDMKTLTFSLLVGTIFRRRGLWNKPTSLGTVCGSSAQLSDKLLGTQLS
jgi:hypothetical protein